MLLSIGTIIPSILTEQKDWRIKLLCGWETLIGELLKTRICLEKISQDTLIIGVYELHWMQELHLLSSQIVQAVNTFLGKEHIKKIRFKLIEELPAAKKLNSRPYIYNIKESKPLNQKQKYALENIKDDELKRMLSSFWHRCSQVQISSE